jgi:hypothetical protein
MRAAGYDWDNVGDERCGHHGDIHLDPYCYRPVGWLERKIYEIEMAKASDQNTIGRTK